MGSSRDAGRIEKFLCCAPQADQFFHGSAEDPQLLRRRSDSNSPMRGNWIAGRRKSGMQLRHFFVRANESFETFRGPEVCLLSAFGPLIESGGAEKEPQCGKLKIVAQLRRNLARVPAFRPTAPIKRISLALTLGGALQPGRVMRCRSHLRSRRGSAAVAASSPRLSAFFSEPRYSSLTLFPGLAIA
jgi:hypothetical protein